MNPEHKVFYDYSKDDARRCRSYKMFLKVDITFYILWKCVNVRKVLYFFFFLFSVFIFRVNFFFEFGFMSKRERVRESSTGPGFSRSSATLLLYFYRIKVNSHDMKGDEFFREWRGTKLLIDLFH